MRRSAQASALVVLALSSALAGCSSGVPGVGQGGAAACAAPTATVSSTEVSPGDVVTLEVVGLFVDCYDTGQGRAPAAADVDVVWQQDGASTVVAVVDADADGHVRQEIRIPDAATAGAAVLAVGPDEAHAFVEPLALTVTTTDG